MLFFSITHIYSHDHIYWHARRKVTNRLWNGYYEAEIKINYMHFNVFWPDLSNATIRFLGNEKLKKLWMKIPNNPCSKLLARFTKWSIVWPLASINYCNLFPLLSTNLKLSSEDISLKSSMHIFYTWVKFFSFLLLTFNFNIYSNFLWVSGLNFERATLEH